jgi:hypothetical protein
MFQGHNPNMGQFFKVVLSVALVFLLSLTFSAQDDLLIQGAVKNKDTMKKMENVTVTVYQNGSVYDSFETTSNGRYKFELPLGSSYSIKFSTEEFLSKAVNLDTRNIPEEDRAGGFVMDMDMTLFAYVEGFDKSILDQPIGKASFDPLKNSIEFDFEYTADVTQQINEEFDRLAGAEEEMEKLRAEFDELVLKGDQKMSQDKFGDAVAKYESALRLIPSDKPAQEKLAEAQAKFDEENALAEREQNYQRLMADGEKKIKSEDYASALDLFEEALDIKPEEKLPEDKIALIKDLMAGAVDQEKYDSLMAEADAYFGDEDYALSIEKYEAASDVKPDEKLPRDKKLEAQRLLDSMLAGMQAEADKIKKYEELLALGKRNMKEENYEVARRNYVDAGEMFPDERVPQDKVEEIDEILAKIAANADADSQAAAENAEQERIDREYTAFIDSANEKFDGENLELAREDYVAASELKSNEKYPKGRITRIDELLAKAQQVQEEDTANSDLADKMREAEEQAAKDKADRDQLAQDERGRRMAEEIAENERLAAPRAREEEAKEDRRARFANEVDSSAEDEAEKYIRAARISEEAAKANKIQKDKDDHLAFLAMKDGDAESTRKDNEGRLETLDENMTAIYRDGDYAHKEKVDAKNALKDRDSAQQEEWIDESDDTRRRNEEASEAKENQQVLLTSNDAHRLAHTDRIDRKKERTETYQSSYIKRGDALRTDNEYNVNSSKDVQTGMAFDGEKVRLENMDEVIEKKDDVVKTSEDVIAASNDRRDSNIDSKEDEKNRLTAIGKGKEDLTTDNYYQVKQAKNNNAEMLANNDLDAENARYDKRKDLFGKDPGSPKDIDDYKLPEGAEDIPEGVSENSYQLGNKIVMERTVKMGNKVDHFRKVVSKSGTYYFKNDKAITANTWKTETINIGD